LDLAEDLLGLDVVVSEVAVQTFLIVFFWNRGQSAVGMTVGWLGLFDKFLILWTTWSSLTGIVCAFLHHEELENSKFMPVWVVLGKTNLVNTTDIALWLNDTDVAAGKAPKDNEGISETSDWRKVFETISCTGNDDVRELEYISAQGFCCSHKVRITFAIRRGSPRSVVKVATYVHTYIVSDGLGRPFKPLSKHCLG